MSNCERIQESLVLFAERELGAAEAAEVASHLQNCEVCRREADEIGIVRGWLADPELFVPESADWGAMAGHIAARAGARPRRWFPLDLGSMGWAASVAASAILACTFLWVLQRRGMETMETPRQAATASGNAAFMRQIQTAYARQAAAEYLSECQDVLLNVVRAGRSCEGEKYDVSIEIVRARQLLERKRLLDGELRAPEIARVRGLCDELEAVLVHLSLSDACENPDGIQRFERLIEREQLLLRINLLKSELS